MMTHPLDNVCCPASKLSEAIDALARRSGLSPRSGGIPNPPQAPIAHDSGSLGRWIDMTVERLGLEAEAVETTFAEVGRFVLGAGPALLCLPGAGEPRLMALLGGRGRSVSILAPDLRVHKVRADIVGAALCGEIEAPVAADVNRMLDEINLPPRRRERVRRAIVRERLGGRRIGSCWLLRLRPSTRFWPQARHAKLHHYPFALLGSYGFQLFALLLAWWILGEGVLGGRLDHGWLAAWALLLLTAVPARLLATWAQGRFAIGAGGLLKQRLLYGALRLEPEEIRHQGAGQILGRVIESASVESLALNGGFLGLLAGLELVVAGAVLGAGAGGGGHVLLLAGWVVLSLLISVWFYRRRHRWTETRLTMSHDLIERMVGHRTRLAQEPRERWHAGEDEALEHYLEQSRAMDRVVVVQGGAARGWLVVGLLGLTPAFVSGSGASILLAVSLGGILLAFMALEKLATSLSSLLSAAIAWRQIASLFEAAARPDDGASPALAWQTGECPLEEGDRLIQAHELTFRYGERGPPVLMGLNLHIRAGDRILLKGSSGGGKSTLATLLTGLRTPASGLLLLGGLDRQTLGSEGWRRRVVTAPQFHENHVLTGTFAFNLLMGRQWPPREEEVRQAEALCRDLGLGDLLERMPAGMLQMVGETGWQLSHGERSRLFMARALLQGAGLVVLDESFAALDPETLKQCLRCVMQRTSTLLVIAHP